MKSSPFSYHFRKTQERDNGSNSAFYPPSLRYGAAYPLRGRVVAEKSEGGTVALGSQFDLLAITSLSFKSGALWPVGVQREIS